MKKLIHATFFAIEGLKYALLKERAFRQEFVLLVIAIPSAYMISKSAEEMLLLIFFFVFVLIVELLNTALEKAIDRISPDTHPLSKIAKDCGAAAVLLSVLMALSFWGLKIFSYLNS
jgi:diacylglycerol kinase (ATP)